MAVTFCSNLNIQNCYSSDILQQQKYRPEKAVTHCSKTEILRTAIAETYCSNRNIYKFYTNRNIQNCNCSALLQQQIYIELLQQLHTAATEVQRIAIAVTKCSNRYIQNCDSSNILQQTEIYRSASAVTYCNKRNIQNCYSSDILQQQKYRELLGQ